MSQFEFMSQNLTAGQLLRKVASIQVPGTERFVAADCLKEANVGFMGDNFKKLFLNLVEEGVGDGNLAVYRLEKDSRDPAIMTELGNRVQTKLAHLFGLLKKQSKGEDGPLLTNGYANVAYIMGNDGNFWVVSADWYSFYGYWVVDAYSVEDPSRWSTGRQVLSCDS